MSWFVWVDASWGVAGSGGDGGRARAVVLDGVGGEFAVGVALVAEVMPDKARPYALSLLQALSTVGNIGAAVTSMSLGHLETTGVLGSLGGWAAWRWMFIIGAFPALLVVVIRRNLKEPERWVQMKASGMDMKKLGDYGELFGNPNWRRPAAAPTARAGSQPAYWWAASAAPPVPG